MTLNSSIYLASLVPFIAFFLLMIFLPKKLDEGIQWILFGSQYPRKLSRIFLGLICLLMSMTIILGLMMLSLIGVNDALEPSVSSQARILICIVAPVFFILLSLIEYGLAFRPKKK